MKRLIAVFLVVLFSVSLCGCALVKRTQGSESTVEKAPENHAKAFYDKVVECQAILDKVATDVCAAWKDACADYELSTNEINQKIEAAKKANNDNIAKANELDKEINSLFEKAKESTDEYQLEGAIKDAMSSYVEYKDSILNANEALNSLGYMDIERTKRSLDSRLRDLLVEL